MAASKADGDLTPDELKMYKKRFIKTMGSRTQTRDLHGGVLALAKKAINDEKPLMPQKVADSINKAGLPYKVKAVSLANSDPTYSFGIKPGLERLVSGDGPAVPRDALRGSSGPPEIFDARKHWPKCAGIIGRIHNQGHCGSCWAFASAQAMDARLCIRTGGNFSGPADDLSRGYIASCVHEAYADGVGNGCEGGWPVWLYKYVEEKKGVPPTGCVPYFAEGDGSEHFQISGTAPPCPTQCTASQPLPPFPGKMEEYEFRPLGIGSPASMYHGAGAKKNPPQAGPMKQAIYEGGPLTYCLAAGPVLKAYSSGVVTDGCGGKELNHAVTAIGWGVEGDMGYVQTVNSWGAHWGDEGMFKGAWCQVIAWTYPGPITETQYPLPVPEAKIPLPDPVSRG